MLLQPIDDKLKIVENLRDSSVVKTETALRRCFRLVCGGCWGFPFPVGFLATFPSSRVCRRRPSPRHGIRLEFSAPFSRARNRNLPCHARRSLGGILAAQSSATLRRNHTSA